MKSKPQVLGAVLVMLFLSFSAAAYAQSDYGALMGDGGIDDLVMEVDGQVVPFGHMAFGPRFDSAGVTAELQIVAGGTSGGCGPIMDDVAGKIALINRGVCYMEFKVYNAQLAGAAAAIILNTDPAFGSYMQPTIYGGAYSITIPSGMMALADADRIRNLTSTAVARKVTPDEYERVVNGFLDSFATSATWPQMNFLTNWCLGLGNIGVIKSSHAWALAFKVDSAWAQWRKGNLDAMDTKLTDFMTQVGELASDGEIPAPFPDVLIACAQMIRVGVGTAAN